MKSLIGLVFIAFLAFGASSAAKPSPRIIGGREAPPHSLPYQVYLYMFGIKNNYYEAWACSGAILSKHYILTSGRCIENATQVDVTMGVHNTSQTEDTQVSMSTIGIYVHPDYKSETNNRIHNDIALLKMSSEIPFNENIQPISLPSQVDLDDMETFVGYSARASGWGLVNGISPDSESDVLRYFDAQVIKNSECKKIFSYIDTSVLCTDGSAKVGICKGDVGGPLVVNSKLIGISSYWAINCITGIPSVYTRVSSYIDWIVANSDVVIV